MRRMMMKTEGFLSNIDKEHPTLEFSHKIPKYNSILIKNSILGVVKPVGFDNQHRPYFSDEFYRRLQEEYKEISRFDMNGAKRLFWFDVVFAS